MLVWLSEIREAFYTFFETGGDVLYVILVATILMWTLIIERLWFFRQAYPAMARHVAAEWGSRHDRSSWYALRIRRLLISELRIELRRFIPLIRTLITLCPLLGLLGTTTGMIEVYDVLALAGTGTPRAMAAGVSKAMVTTMAGLVAALSGVFFVSRLERWARREADMLEAHLPIETHTGPSPSQS